jgi:hypothetical protein
MEATMKALIICSLHALCDISRFEQDACNRACAMHGISAILTPQDHSHALANTTMLDLLSHLPGSEADRKALIDSYLEVLNDEVWGASLHVHNSVFTTLLDPKGYARKTGIVSDYPMLTTNLVRSSALFNNATKLGTLTVPSDLLAPQNIQAGLAACATTLGMMYNDVEVLVAHQRDYDAAQSIGMHPRLIEEIRPDVTAQKRRRKARIYAPKRPIFDSMPIPVPVGMPA